MVASDELLPTAVLRQIGDKLYEKRKAAALDVEQLIKRLALQNDQHRIRLIIDKLISEYAFSSQANHRKARGLGGALLCLAASAVGLADPSEVHLRQIVPPVLASFTDQDARVARGTFILFFNEVFDAMFRLCADSEANVQSAVQFLDALIKDIAADAEAFDVAAFIPKLRDYLRVTHPHKRAFLLSWVALLDSLPHVRMLRHLPALLDGLCGMLAEPVREVRTQAANCLKDFLSEIRACPPAELSPDFFSRLTAVLVDRAGSADELTRLTALHWLRSFVELAPGRLLPHVPAILGVVLFNISSHNPDIQRECAEANAALLRLEIGEGGAFGAVRAATGAAPTVDMGAILGTVILEMRSEMEPTRLEALRWLHFLLARAQALVLEQVGRLLPPLLDSLSAPSDAVVASALGVVAALADCPGQFSAVLVAFLDRFRGEAGAALLQRSGSSLLRRLCSHLGAEAVLPELGAILAREQDSGFAATMVSNPDMMERKCWITMMRSFSSMGGTVSMSKDLTMATDLSERIIVIQQFRSVMSAFSYGTSTESKCVIPATDETTVCTESKGQSKCLSTWKRATGNGIMLVLNLILLTGPELAELRDQLRRAAVDPAGARLFSLLYPSWCYSAGALLSLCFVAQAYDHAADIVNAFADLPFGTELLVQIDRLVALLETPCFTFLRLQLLEPRRHPALLRALYGLLMLLPQCNAFRMLNTRLQAVPTLQLLQLGSPGPATAADTSSSAPAGSTPTSAASWADFDSLLATFRTAQLRQYESYVQQRRPPPLLAVGAAGPGVTLAASVTDRPTVQSTADTGGVPYVVPAAGFGTSTGGNGPSTGRPSISVAGAAATGGGASAAAGDTFRTESGSFALGPSFGGLAPPTSERPPLPPASTAPSVAATTVSGAEGQAQGLGVGPGPGGSAPVRAASGGPLAALLVDSVGMADLGPVAGAPGPAAPPTAPPAAAASSAAAQPPQDQPMVLTFGPVAAAAVPPPPAPASAAAPPATQPAAQPDYDPFNPFVSSAPNPFR
ncbi:hypothetical protein GPECTOR_49g488 [Gonium pectorale]|uniref:Vacuolar protein 14 C-terminal Fig4-binding domain-containing protein n=1 Tax=Gonium pectorale TaxID=33097 RepID=A0A150G7U0_GONPE|nr:hypothetical protein GPECTOR_49g488 [Gonium pectorale]|eukprot:KXZ45904.1 hypothetical protein GPECTOR_49g488 [Gonium pectorale]